MLSSNSETPFFATRKEERAFLWLLAAMQFSHIVDFMILMPLGPSLMDIFSITPKTFGTLVSAYTFSAGISSVLAAMVIDRFDRKRALLFVYTGFMAGTLLCGLAPNVHLLLLARILTGGFGGVVSSLILSLIPDAVPVERRGEAMGTVMMSFSLASIAGVPIGLFLANHLGWPSPFFVLSALSLGMLAIGFVKLPTFKPKPRAAGFGPLHDFATILQRPIHWRAFAFTFLMMGSTFLIIPFLSPTLVANAAVDQQHLFMVYLVGGLVTFFTMPFFGKLGDKKGLFKVYAGITVTAVIPVFWVTHLGPWGLWGALPVTTLFMAIISGRAAPGMALVSTVVEPRLRGGFMSLNTALQQIASGAASLVAAQMITRNVTGQLEGFPVVGYLACLGLLLSVAVASSFKVYQKPQMG